MYFRAHAKLLQKPYLALVNYFLVNNLSRNISKHQI